MSCVLNSCLLLVYGSCVVFQSLTEFMPLSLPLCDRELITDELLCALERLCVVVISVAVTCDSVFSEIIQILPFIRRINASHAKQLNDIKMSTPQILFPPLHSEVFNKMD